MNPKMPLCDRGSTITKKAHKQTSPLDKMWLREILLVAFLITLSKTKSFPRAGACDDSQSAVIFLQGLAPDFTLLTNFFTGPTMGNTVRIRLELQFRAQNT